MTIIPYCFVDKRSYDKLNCKVRAAVRLWSDALGDFRDGIWGPENKHSLAFLPPPNLPRSQNFNPYCCNYYTYGGEGMKLDRMTELKCDWNTNDYPTDTLTIHWLDDVKGEGGAIATLGYYHDVPGEESVPGRHDIVISESANTHTIAHELGHVLGMAHEHQRWDRDDYVYFRCENVKGMKERVEYAHRLNGVPNGIPIGEVWEFLCEKYAQATFWEAPSRAWIRGDGFKDIDEGKSLDGPDGFDYDSIMMYGSAQGVAVPYLSQVTMHTATLVKIKKNPTTGEKFIDRNDWWLPIPTRVSQKDAAFVRRFYPWGQPWKPPQNPPPALPNPPPEIEDPPPEPQGPAPVPQAPSTPPPGTPPPIPPRPTRRPAKPSESS
ncbi:uncharacterized protein N0V89_012365 [Didymosphaeria variabile]|uniref:Metalloendopeptidase n=1 Tax=Didymosphaeria variabile TaxID=1932322 RepID=A0A9W8X994_9PLEO|nr:uncharacterized protein N0V89_012365 [Didymosphaeria variabile]KAJ4344621.1 hypothetical protein N0V89_012365 [Didymosphaeria variabile]